jgi:DNA-binding IclR family transcriptional regulator
MLSENDVSNGLSALAAPVFNASGAMVAAVSIGGLTPQISNGTPPVLLAPLLECARKLTDFFQAHGDSLPLMRAN